LLESIDVEDFVQIGFQIEQGNYRPIDKLSTGQKATVIVLLSMVEGDRPIIFDQPEDALYTPFIYSEVVKILKQEKDSRQFILATHNANISIASDLDLGIILEGSANKASVEAAGGLDDEETRSLMVIHLEGGEEAFSTRGKKLRLT
jgi:ABC-type lipoprotein export system ATPase subunit